MSKPYNGHPSYNAWNVALWIGNDEGLYNFARDCKRNCSGTLRQAALNFVREMEDIGQPRTGDGVRWTVTNVMRAMRDL
jgi:hypothetical protein